MTHVFTYAVYGGCVVAALVGLLYVKRGWWPARGGDIPHCRRCDYTLTGIRSDRCPECGGDVSGRGTVRGDRRQVRRVAVAGLALIVVSTGIAGSLAWRTVRQVDWYRHRPFGWLMRDLDPAKGYDGVRAWGELRRRAYAGELNEAQRQAFVNRLLAEQEAAAVTSLTTPMMRELVAFAFENRLSPEQRARFIAAATRMSLTVPTQGTVGTPVPYHVKGTGRAGAEIAWLHNARLTLFLDGAVLRDQTDEQTGWGLGLASFAGTIRVERPGHYRLRAVVEIRVGENEVLLFGNDEPDVQVLTAEFDVTAAP